MNSSKLKGYLTGLIIGDGHIAKGVTKRGFRIKSIYEDFIDRIIEDLNSCNTFKITKHYSPSKIDKNNVTHKEYWEIHIKAHPYFAKKYHNFYDDYRGRTISKNAINWLNDIGLANWYMSDGYICLVGKTKDRITNRRLEICTDRYNYDDIKMVCGELSKKFNLDFSIIKRGKQFRMRLKSKDYCKFINVIKPYILPSIMYKLYLGYEMQPKWMTDEDWSFQNSISAIALTSEVEG